MSDPENDKFRPMPASQQLYTQWVIKVWDNVSEK